MVGGLTLPATAGGVAAGAVLGGTSGSLGAAAVSLTVRVPFRSCRYSKQDYEQRNSNGITSNVHGDVPFVQVIGGALGMSEQ